MPIASDLDSLIPKPEPEDDRPLYLLWAYDPNSCKVHVDHNENRHPAHALTHSDLAPEITSPDRVNGFAYSIKDGWRITDAEHRKVNDPFIVKRVLQSLRNEEPDPDLPHIRYHGDPGAPQ